jgi:translation elongation factor EF-Tu-like GTPase
MIIGTAGHIDHGKTALVRALTGTDIDRLKEDKGARHNDRSGGLRSRASILLMAYFQTKT